MFSRNVSYEPFFYPLDKILRWNRLYGVKGFQQYQCVIPESEGSGPITEILSAISKSGTGSFLAVLKRFGDVTSPGLLSFPKPGVTLALDFPEKNSETRILFSKLDAIVGESGGRLYAAKDAHMDAAFFRTSYPEWGKLEAKRDPALLSRFWARVTNL